MKEDLGKGMTDREVKNWLNGSVEPDLEIEDGPTSSVQIALITITIAAVLGTMFYVYNTFP